MHPRLKPVNQQTIVITGASSGIGLATARMAAERGAAVVLAARSEEELETIAADLRERGGRVAVVAADVAKMEDVERIATAASSEFGGFDSWVNDAAAATYGTIEEVSLEDHRRIFDVNYFGVVHGSLVAARHLRERGGGAIINLGSVLSDRAIPLQGPYCATKHAVKAFTDTLRIELMHDEVPISVTLIKPSGIDTPYPEHARNYMDEAPRLPPPVYDPELVARAILFACENVKRDLIVGGAGYALVAAGNMTPGLADRIMARAMYPAQKTPSGGDVGEGDPGRRDNLYQPREDGAVHGSQNYAVRKNSLYLEAQMRPALTTAILGGLGMLAVAAANGPRVVSALRRGADRRQMRLDPRSGRPARHGRQVAAE